VLNSVVSVKNIRYLQEARLLYSKGLEAKYRAAEQKSRENKIGMWAQPSLMQRLGGTATKAPETPREYKNRHTAADKTKKAA
jgi:hypothetical protein